MIILNVCKSSDLLLLFVILKYVFSITCTIIPFIVMYRTIVPLFNSVITAKKVTEHLLPITKSLIAGLVVFLLPTLFSYVFTYLLDYSDSGLTECFTNATLENVYRLREKEADERKANLEENKKQQSIEQKKRQEELDKRNEAIKKEREEREKQQQQENNNNNNHTSNSSVNKAYGTLYVGDSRTAGYSTQVTIKETDSIYATVGGAMNEFNSDISKALQKINSDSSHRYNLVLNYGANNLGQDWVTAYKNVIKQVNGKANILVVSINPCNEKIARYLKNKNIEVVNKKLKKAFDSKYDNVKYCDTYTPFINTPNYIKMIETQEGIHYTNEGGQFIFNKINSCLNLF